MTWQGARDDVAAALGSTAALYHDVGTALLQDFDRKLAEYAKATLGGPEPIETTQHAIWRTTTMPAYLSAQRALAHAYDGQGTADTGPADASPSMKYRGLQKRLKEAADMGTVDAAGKALLARAARAKHPPEPNQYAGSRAASGQARGIATALDRLEEEASAWLDLVSP